MHSNAGEPRLAKNYRLVYNVVREQGAGRHLAMSDVYGLVRERGADIGFTTVYRALLRLRDLGLVSEILLPGADSAVYEPASNAHAHFRCDACGRVEDVEYVLPPRVVRDLARRGDVEVASVALSLHGRCRVCKST